MDPKQQLPPTNSSKLSEFFNLIRDVQHDTLIKKRNSNPTWIPSKTEIDNGFFLLDIDERKNDEKEDLRSSTENAEIRKSSEIAESEDQRRESEGSVKSKKVERGKVFFSLLDIPMNVTFRSTMGDIILRPSETMLLVNGTMCSL